MGLTLTSVHETAKDPNTGMDRIVAENPYLRIKQGEYPPLYIQRGQAYDESGNTFKPLPDWAKEEIAKASPEALAKVGWKQQASVETGSKSQHNRIEAQKPEKRKYTKNQATQKKPAPQPEPADVGLDENEED
jgi:hypothetical protein